LQRLDSNGKPLADEELHKAASKPLGFLGQVVVCFFTAIILLGCVLLFPLLIIWALQKEDTMDKEWRKFCEANDPNKKD